MKTSKQPKTVVSLPGLSRDHCQRVCCLRPVSQLQRGAGGGRTMSRLPELRRFTTAPSTPNRPTARNTQQLGSRLRTRSCPFYFYWGVLRGYCVAFFAAICHVFGLWRCFCRGVVLSVTIIVDDITLSCFLDILARPSTITKRSVRRPTVCIN